MISIWRSTARAHPSHSRYLSERAGSGGILVPTEAFLSPAVNRLVANGLARRAIPSEPRGVKVVLQLAGHPGGMEAMPRGIRGCGKRRRRGDLPGGAERPDGGSRATARRLLFCSTKDRRLQRPSILEQNLHGRADGKEALSGLRLRTLLDTQRETRE